MMRLILVRHGQTEWNAGGRYQGQSNVALSSLGRRQAELLAASFPVKQLDAIYASDLDRARETAECVGKAFGIPVRPEKAFRELSFGDWEGLTYQEISSRWPKEANKLFTAPDELCIPNGETFQDLQKRALDKIDELCKIHDGQNVGVFAHGAINKTILAGLMHIPLHYLWSLRQDNTAVNILKLEDGYVTVELLNGTFHLGDDAKTLGL
ncbi:MAG: histidine phosphatase family protein [Schwartzia sp.]|nr:histidine phosphatase family protein [Schwartzia sp. (in: firmicutes)]